MGGEPDILARERIWFIGAIGAVVFHFMRGERRDDHTALVLQRTETERRLHDLNNEAGRLQDAVTANVSSDTFQGFERRVRNIETSISRLSGALILVTFTLPVASSVIVYFLTRK